MSHLSTPFDNIRIRCQIQKEISAKYIGSVEMTKLVFKNHGIRGIFAGYQVNLLRESVGGALYFGWYETVKNRLYPVD